MNPLPGSRKSKFGHALLILVCGLISVCPASFAQNARRTLHAHVPSAVRNLQPLGRVPGSTPLTLCLGLPLRDPELLTNLLQQIYDPVSPNFRRFLTPERFTELFGPAESDYQALITFVNSQGLAVASTHPNRMVLEVSGSVANIERAFQLKIWRYQHPRENRTFFASDAAPSVPAHLRVADITGLTDYARPKPRFSLKNSAAQSNNATPKAGSGPSGNYMGLDFRKAYAPGVSLTGAGQTIALVQFDGYVASDIAAYTAQAGLPNVPLQNVLLNGFNGVPTGSGGEVEVSLDIEMVISMAPGLSKVIVYEGSPYNFLPNTVLNRIATDNSARQISCSWGWTGGPNSTTEQIFLQMAVQGQSFFNASGDDDAFVPGQVDDPNYFGTPSASPNVTQVGGTTLTTSGSGSWVSEKVWNWGGGVGSSGGISSYYSIPAWQQGVSMAANGGSTTHRNIPDVALTADNVYVIADNGVHYTGVGGTSVAAPLWAGFAALVNQQVVANGGTSIGFVNPVIYAIGQGANYSSDFHDIKTGDNRWSGSPNLFLAVTGYDLCTGWGTPVGLNLINELTLGGTPDGILEVSVTPPDGSTLVEGATQPVIVQVTDASPVTDATVVATINGGASLVFTNNGVPPDATANDSFYSANLTVPLNTNDLTLSFLVTAPGKTNSTNVVVYNVVSLPPNDYFTNAIKVPTNGATYLSNNRFGTKEAGEPQHAGIAAAAASLWWNWSPATTTNVFIDTTGSDIDTVLAVYTGSTVTNLTVVAATNDVGASQQAYLNLDVTAGASYRIAVASASSNSVGSLRLRIAPGGQRDTNAPTVVVTDPLSGQWVSNFLLTVSGTANDPQPNASGISRVLVNLNGRSYVASGTTNWSYTLGLKEGLNTITASAVDIAGNVSAPVSIQVTYVIVDPVNDLFVNAFLLSGNSGTVTAISTNASKEYNEPYHGGNAGGKSVWWSFQPSVDGVLSLTTTNSNFDTLLGVYTGTKVGELTTIAGNDDAGDGSFGTFSALSQAIRANQTYYIAVDGFDGASGNVSLGYTFTPGTVYTLTVGSAGNGQVSPGTGDVAANSTVTLTATPDPFFQFDGWTGSFASPNNPLSVFVSADLNLTAHFRSINFTDDFETGNLFKIGWATSGNAPWSVQTSNVLAGTFSAKSGAIGDNQTSSLTLTTNFVGGTVLFYLKVSSEPNWDFLKFYTDGVLQQQWSGEINWTSYSFPLSAGSHTLEWRYSKDASLIAGLDAAFIDDVNLPLAAAASSASAASLKLTQQPGGLMLQIQGQANQVYVVQASTNLVDWLPISTNVPVNGMIQVMDPGATTNRVRFYRAIVP